MPVFLLPILSGIAGAMRIPAIAAFLAGLAAQFVAWFGRFVARGAALNLAVVALVVTLAVGVGAGFWLMLEGLKFVLPPEFGQGMGFITPPNAIPCLSTVAAARITRWVWEWQIHVIAKVTS